MWIKPGLYQRPSGFFFHFLAELDQTRQTEDGQTQQVQIEGRDALCSPSDLYARKKKHQQNKSWYTHTLSVEHTHTMSHVSCAKRHGRTTAATSGDKDPQTQNWTSCSFLCIWMGRRTLRQGLLHKDEREKLCHRVSSLKKLNVLHIIGVLSLAQRFNIAVNKCCFFVGIPLSAASTGNWKPAASKQAVVSVWIWTTQIQFFLLLELKLLAKSRHAV